MSRLHRVTFISPDIKCLSALRGAGSRRSSFQPSWSLLAIRAVAFKTVSILNRLYFAYCLLSGVVSERSLHWYPREDLFRKRVSVHFPVGSCISKESFDTPGWIEVPAVFILVWSQFTRIVRRLIIHSFTAVLSFFNLVWGQIICFVHHHYCIAIFSCLEVSSWLLWDISTRLVSKITAVAV